ncbi:MAG: mannose-6-phosphate isomerase [Clostridiales bacterium]|jgi:mannose-6-phosphate isomerase class I|nr:mannose-6-phosphate isomerase [Clostridiales bacterium]
MVQGYGNYDLHPYVTVKQCEGQCFCGDEEIRERLKQNVTQGKTVVCVDCYQGVRQEEIERLFAFLRPVELIDAQTYMRSEQEIEDMLRRNITDDRVFGVLSCHRLEEFFPEDSFKLARQRIEAVQQGVVLVIGPGASLLCDPDVLIYADMPRWELQTRMKRNEVANLRASNYEEEFLRKYKRSFFIDWRVLDRHKAKLFSRMDYLLDTTAPGQPKMITGQAHLEGLRQAAARPFRVVPFFDPGVWGGQWMKKVCNLEEGPKNYAWCFDCIPEENSLCLGFGDVRVEIPSINLVLREPLALLGEKVYARFGTEFPIRFDFLDTMDGQNLSLQVHPLTEYIQQTFGMHYTQDESYYLLDAEEDATVYLGLKEGIDPQEMMDSLEEAQSGETPFDAERFVNRLPAKKHDHFLIPAGTIHCSGKNAMVLEISATPYIFTFKMWDWGRLGLDGKPRPIHLQHARQVIDWSRDTAWVQGNLANQVETISQEDGIVEERTGLHQREFIETRRHWFDRPVTHHTNGSVNVLNLVEGEAAVVESPTCAFEPFTVHYAETFIIPAQVGEYRIRPAKEGQKAATIKAYVRT